MMVEDPVSSAGEAGEQTTVDLASDSLGKEASSGFGFWLKPQKYSSRGLGAARFSIPVRRGVNSGKNLDAWPPSWRAD